MNYDEITQAVNCGEWETARRALSQYKKEDWNDTLAILKASICLAEGKREEAFDAIREGLAYNNRNYELYLLLGNYYESMNVNQAWLCCENAEFYCDNDEDAEIIRQYKRCLEAVEGWCVKPLSIVILSYNIMQICKECIESIRKNNPKQSYELIVVDNASVDGVVEWLKTQEDIHLILNEVNEGFPYACNRGIKAAKPDNDIFLLNNDTVVFENSIFWLRMGLYEKGRVGAAGSVSNLAANQMIEETFQTVEEYASYAAAHNLPMRNACESVVWLVGFAMMIKREALDEVGLFDRRFSLGSFEDCDLSVRLQYAGWKLNLCWNSFILHYGGGQGVNREVWKRQEKENEEKFKEKWNFDIQYYSFSRTDLLSMITDPADQAIRVLEVGCGCGATLSKLKYMWPNAQVSGIELSEEIARIRAHTMDIVSGNIETMELSYEKGSFDYIMFGDVLEHLFDPEAILKKLTPFLKENGRFLCSIPNIMHESVIRALLKGEFNYKDQGILDRTHIRFFTLDSIVKMLKACGLKIENLTATFGVSQEAEEDSAMLEALYKIPGVADKNLFSVYQFLFLAGRE